MTEFEWITTLLSIIAILIIPLFVAVARGVRKTTRNEDRLENLIDKVSELIRDKDQTHSELERQIADISRSLDQRIRWLEVNLWQQKQRGQT